MRRFTVPGTLAFVSMVAAGCDRTPPTDPRSFLALRMEADQAPAPKNFVAHLTGANAVPAHESRGVGQITLQPSDDGSELRSPLISSNLADLYVAAAHAAPADVE